MKRPCLDCGILTTATRCTACQRNYRSKYGATHQRTRAEWAPVVEGGEVCCWRCRRPIVGAWHLGHRSDGSTHPEHERCNLSAAGRGTQAGVSE